MIIKDNGIENIDILRSLALMEFEEESYFIKDGIAYEGEETDNQENWVEVEEYVNDWDKKYAVYTDTEANEKAKEYILDTLWAFNPEFIVGHTLLPWEAVEMVEDFCQKRCEDANDTIFKLITDTDELVKAAIKADGRAHFMNIYDGKEDEVVVQGETFYIYRQN